MKKVLFHYPVLNIGGAEKSSLRMMRALCDRGWNVTLVLTTGGGTLEKRVDPRVTIDRLRPLAFGTKFKAANSIKDRVLAFPDLLGYCAMRLIGLAKMVPYFFRRYDAAAVLLMGTSSHFVRNIVKANTRAIWIRNDLSGADPSGTTARSLRHAAKNIDHFICVSEVSRKSLLEVVPQARGKDRVVYNILNSGHMLSEAHNGSAPFPLDKENGPVVLTVCRLSERAKGLLRMARICATLKENGLAFRWYIVGDGPDRHLLEAAITELGIADRMILLGTIENPFPAYRAADLVAMLSNYEGLCGVINEARVLEKPVIATVVSGIDEQLVDGLNGVIVNQDEEAIVKAMMDLIVHPEKRIRISAGGYPEKLTNDSAKLDELESIFSANGQRK